MNNYILIVEDDEDLLKAYDKILSTVTDNVKCAPDGLKALEIIESNGNPALIFLDSRMPNMDGISFLEKFDPKTKPATKVILFSNYDTKKEIDRAYELGVDRYVLKARVTPRELIKIAENAVKNTKNS